MLPLPQYPSRNSLSGISQSGRKDPSSAYRLYGFERFHEFPATGRFCPRQYFPCKLSISRRANRLASKNFYINRDIMPGNYRLRQPLTQPPWKPQVRYPQSILTTGSVMKSDFPLLIRENIGRWCRDCISPLKEVRTKRLLSGKTIWNFRWNLPGFTRIARTAGGKAWVWVLTGLSVSGEKLKNNTGYGNDLFKTSPLGLRFTVCHQHASHFFWLWIRLPVRSGKYLRCTGRKNV